MTCPSPQKQTYETYKRAVRALRAIRHPQGGLAVYRCGDHWHLGHPDKQITKRRKRRDAERESR